MVVASAVLILLTNAGAVVIPQDNFEACQAERTRLSKEVSERYTDYTLCINSVTADQEDK